MNTQQMKAALVQVAEDCQRLKDLYDRIEHHEHKDAIDVMKVQNYMKDIRIKAYKHLQHLHNGVQELERNPNRTQAQIRHLRRMKGQLEELRPELDEITAAFSTGRHAMTPDTDSERIVSEIEELQKRVEGLEKEVVDKGTDKDFNALSETDKGKVGSRLGELIQRARSLHQESVAHNLHQRHREKITHHVGEKLTHLLRNAPADNIHKEALREARREMNEHAHDDAIAHRLQKAEARDSKLRAPKPKMSKVRKPEE